MSKQQTALDLYIDKINESCRESGIHFQLYNEGKEYEQAKAMEKEQIIEAHNNGKFILPPNENGEQYYNETYES